MKIRKRIVVSALFHDINKKIAEKEVRGWEVILITSADSGLGSTRVSALMEKTDNIQYCSKCGSLIGQLSENEKSTFNCQKTTEGSK